MINDSIKLVKNQINCSNLIYKYLYNMIIYSNKIWLKCLMVKDSEVLIFENVQINKISIVENFNKKET